MILSLYKKILIRENPYSCIFYAMWEERFPNKQRASHFAYDLLFLLLTFTPQKMKFSIKETANLVTFTEEILNGKFLFLCSDWKSKCWLKSSLLVYFALCPWKKINCSSYGKIREITITVKNMRELVFSQTRILPCKDRISPYSRIFCAVYPFTYLYTWDTLISSQYTFL